jgi:hypothetical protein
MFTCTYPCPARFRGRPSKRHSQNQGQNWKANVEVFPVLPILLGGGEHQSCWQQTKPSHSLAWWTPPWRTSLAQERGERVAATGCGHIAQQHHLLLDLDIQMQKHARGAWYLLPGAGESYVACWRRRGGPFRRGPQVGLWGLPTCF